MPHLICLAAASSFLRGFSLCGMSDVQCRWLLRRTQGVLLLHHHGLADEDKALSAQERDRQECIALVIIPLLSGTLSPETSLHLDLTWGMSALQHLLACVVGPY